MNKRQLIVLWIAGLMLAVVSAGTGETLGALVSIATVASLLVYSLRSRRPGSPPGLQPGAQLEARGSSRLPKVLIIILLLQWLVLAHSEYRNWVLGKALEDLSGQVSSLESDLSSLQSDVWDLQN